MNTVRVKVKKLHPDAIIPKYHTAQAMCFDLSVVDEVAVRGPNMLMALGTGLAFEIPKGYGMEVFIRSSLAKKGVKLANSVGIIDSDYRGEVILLLEFTSVELVDLRVGTRVAQARIVPVYQANFREVEELTPTTRGEGGFGSTGTKP